MHYKRAVTFVFIMTAMFIAHAQAQGQLSNEKVVPRLNRVLAESIATPGLHPRTVMPVRNYPMVHAAMFDAADSIDGKYTAYLIDVPGSRQASPEAAQAAHDVLVALYPARSGVFAAELADSLNDIDPIGPPVRGPQRRQLCVFDLMTPRDRGRK